MNKQQKIKDAKTAFLNCEGTFLEKCKLAQKYLDVVYRNGSLDLITHSKEWKENRAKKLKDCCETCGSTEGLHISHTWHPPRKKEMNEHIKRVHGDKLRLDVSYGEKKDACPVCSSTSVKFLKTRQHWKCYGQRVEFKPQVQYQIEQWEKTKDNDGIRSLYYKKYSVDTDEKVVGSIQGLSYDTSKCFGIVPENYCRATRAYWQNRHKVSCGAVFDEPSDKLCEKKIDSRMVWRYYYAMEQISLTDRYIEMRDGDILTECKKCGFERDKERISEKKEKKSVDLDSMSLEKLKRRYLAMKNGQ
jgi:hypothetical protein